MVHLSKVKKGKQAQKSQREQKEAEDTATPYVYGTHYAVEELPEHVMSEQEMPADVAFRLVKDELSLDGNPLLK
jgi:glutamate decarboxylase